MAKIKGTTKSNGNKHVLDKFYTKPEVVEQCLSFLELEKYDCIIEPSAGNGSFSSKIPNVKAFDIAPENDSIAEADWLNLDKTQFHDFSKTLIIGNPPFGTKGSLAHKFMVESMKFADTVAFILPKGFKKDSMKNRIPLNFSLTHESDLRKDSFTLNGENYDVPCVFQIWKKSKTMRHKVIKRNTSELFEFVTEEAADFRIQRVGGSAGKAYSTFGVSPAVNYFLKNTSAYSTEDLIEAINKTVFPTINHTTGPRSLPKGELIECVEAYFNGNKE